MIMNCLMNLFGVVDEGYVKEKYANSFITLSSYEVRCIMFSARTDNIYTPPPHQSNKTKTFLTI